jgi:hypothetical protein
MTGYSLDLRITEVHDKTSQHKTIADLARTTPP